LLSAHLDDGEAEAIVVARERHSHIVLLDEKDARRAARRLGLKVLGTVGVLIWAKRSGHIVSLRGQLDMLRGRGKFRLGQKVYDGALRVVGEMDK